MYNLAGKQIASYKGPGYIAAGHADGSVTIYSKNPTTSQSLKKGELTRD